VDVRLDDLSGPQIARLLQEHLRSMRQNSPPESVHALDLAHLRKGVATRLLQHILEEAGRRGYRRVSLETGSGPAFAPALSLYTRFGFRPCGPFADYAEDPFSVFMARDL
jgi:putative acetyltransferase